MAARTLIVVPAFNEGERLPGFLADVGEVLAARGELDVLVADDGSAEDHARRMEAAVVETRARFDLAGSRIVYRRHALNRGKGAVLRDGFAQGCADGHDVVGFLDADGSTPFAEGARLTDRLRAEWKDADAVIGCRLKCLGIDVERKLSRHVVGRVFATMVSTLFGIPVYDSQCGAKFFKASALTPELLALCDDDRWIFDTQLLVASWLTGVRVREIPVQWHEVPGSKVSFVRDPARMAKGLLRFRRRLAEHGIAVGR